MFGGTAMPLAGVSFSLYADAEHTQQIAGPVFADENGYFAFYGLPVSSTDPNWHVTYYYQEDASSVPAGYVAASGSFAAETTHGTYNKGTVADARKSVGNFAFRRCTTALVLQMRQRKAIRRRLG